MLSRAPERPPNGRVTDDHQRREPVQYWTRKTGRAREFWIRLQRIEIPAEAIDQRDLRRGRQRERTVGRPAGRRPRAFALLRRPRKPTVAAAHGRLTNGRNMPSSHCVAYFALADDERRTILPVGLFERKGIAHQRSKDVRRVEVEDLAKCPLNERRMMGAVLAPVHAQRRRIFNRSRLVEISGIVPLAGRS